MITNKPLPPRAIYRTGRFPSQFSAWDWVTDQIPVTAPEQERTYHGMQVHFDRVANEWQRIVNIVGQSGVCTYLLVAIKNNTGSSKEAGVRVNVDGNTIYSDERIEVPGNVNTGIALIGKMYFKQSPVELGGMSRGFCPFNSSFIVEVFTDNISQMEIAAAYRAYWTY